MSDTKGIVSTFGGILDSTDPKIVDLPVSTGNPTEIAIPSRACQITFQHVDADFHATWHTASDAAGAKTRIDSDLSRFKVDSPRSIPVSSNKKSLYIRSIGAAVVDGTSFFFIRPD